MTLEKKLYTVQEVGQIIKSAVNDIAGKLASSPNTTLQEQETIMRQWSNELLPTVEDAVAEEVVRRHVQGINLSVWVGPPGSGKGTNIDTVNLLGNVYAEVVSQGGARVLEEPFHSTLLKLSVAQSMISTGTKGIFNRPEGEYLELFGALIPVVGKLVADGGFPSDNMVSVLVELMILYRLTQNFHKIQIDLWPRTGPQFADFTSLINKIESAKGKVISEIVTIKVLKPVSLQIVKSNLLESAAESRKIAARIKELVASDWYKDSQKEALALTDLNERYNYEEKALAHVFDVLTQEFVSAVDVAIIEELHAVCDRMTFRFHIVVSAGIEPRPDEFPLSVIRRLSIYTGETSPAFLEAAEKTTADKGFYVVSSAGTPEEVVSEILDVLAQAKSDDPRWQEVKKVAGEIAVAVVNRKELIVDELVRRVGGILNS